MLCNKCLKEKLAVDFSYKNRDKRILSKICKTCHSLYRRSHYLKNKEKYILKANKWNLKQKQILSKYIFNKLSQSHCYDCGEKDILVLEFDHISDKKLGISEMYKNSYSLKSLEKELKRCVVRCANCHRRKTAKEKGYWKFKMI